jgi:uncharacterized protein YdcH (DUF465 family)
VNLKGKDKVKNKDETAQQLADALEIDKEEVLKNFHEGRTQVEIGKIGRNLSPISTCVRPSWKFFNTSSLSISSASANCCAVSSLFLVLVQDSTTYRVVVNLKGKDKVKNKDETAQQLADAFMKVF